MSQESDLRKTFGRNLRVARKRAGLIQKELAEKLGVHREVIGRFERGDLWPSINNLHRLCKILNVSADTLLGFDTGEEPSVVPRPPEDPLPLRRVMRALRTASQNTRRVVAWFLDELEKRGRL